VKLEKKFRYSEKYLSKLDLATTNPTWNGLDSDEISGSISCRNFVNFEESPCSLEFVRYI
jgi:hypothetical protein